jgi:hypothetical protein
MNDLISKLNGGELLALCGILLGLFALIGGMTIGFAKVISEHYRKSQRDEMEATLKMEMIQRGMSAGEIKQVLEAKMGGTKPSWADMLTDVASNVHIHS